MSIVYKAIRGPLPPRHDESLGAFGIKPATLLSEEGGREEERKGGREGDSHGHFPARLTTPTVSTELRLAIVH